MLQKFEQLWSFATGKIDIKNKQLILANGRVDLQLPDNRDFDPDNVAAFTKHYIKDLVASSPTQIDISKKVERVNSNLNALSGDSNYSEYKWISDFRQGSRLVIKKDKDIVTPNSHTIAAAKVIAKNIPENIIDNLPLPVSEKNTIKTVGSFKKGSPGLSR